MMNAPPYGSAEELEQAMATLTDLYEVMLVDAIHTGNDKFLDELAVWMETFRRKEAIQQALKHIRTLEKIARTKLLAATPMRRVISEGDYLDVI